MKLYHYNTNSLEVLSSTYHRDKQSNRTDDPYDYRKNISFFMEPVPRNLASILNHEHKFWKKGITLIEHEIDTSFIENDIYYRLVESTEKTKLIYEKQNWDIVRTNPELREVYIKQIDDLEKKLNLKSKGITNLIKVASKYKGIKKYYEDMYIRHKEHPEDGLMEKYAATVPHLMTYPKAEYIKVLNRKEISLR